MTGIFQGDLIILQALRLGLEDLRKNAWLIDHIFSSTEDPAEIANIRSFFENNQFPVLMSNRIDSPPAYFISIGLGESREMKDMAFLGDMSNSSIDLSPQAINKPIPYVVKPFTIVSYDPTTGIITMPDVPEYAYLNVGMLSVNSETGEALKILEVLGNSRYAVAINSVVSSKQAIVPQYPLYSARYESATFNEKYTIGVHASGDMLYAIWLHSIISYCLLRYRESLLEGKGLQLTTFSSSDYSKNASYQSIGENMFSRYISIEGQVQNFWIKSPQRFIESVALQDPNSINPAGIKIISSDRLPGADSQNDLWTTVSDNDDVTNDNDDDDPFWK